MVIRHLSMPLAVFMVAALPVSPLFAASPSGKVQRDPSPTKMQSAILSKLSWPYFSKSSCSLHQDGQKVQTQNPPVPVRSKSSISTGKIRSQVFCFDADTTASLPDVTADTSGPMYTLVKLQNLARRKNPTFTEYAAARGMAYAEILRAQTWSNPEFNAGIGRAGSKTDDSKGVEFDLGISQPIEWPGKRKARIEAAAAAVPVVEEGENVFKADLYADVARAYYHVLFRQADLINSERALRTEQEIEQVVGRRVENKEVPSIDLAKARVETMKQSRMVSASKRRLAAARVALNLLTGNSLPNNYVLDDTLTAPLRGVSMDQARKTALANHPELARLEALYNQRVAEAMREEKAWLPELKPGIGLGSELDKRVINAAVNLAIPLWDRNKAGVLVARAELMKTQAELDGKRREVMGKVEEAILNYETMRDSVMVFSRDGLREVTAEALRVETALYTEGDGVLLNLFDARRTERTTQDEYYRALYDAQLARVDLERALGVTGE